MLVEAFSKVIFGNFLGTHREGISSSLCYWHSNEKLFTKHLNSHTTNEKLNPKLREIDFLLYQN